MEIRVISVPWFVTPKEDIDYILGTIGSIHKPLPLNKGISYLAFKASLYTGDMSIVIMSQDRYWTFKKDSNFNEFILESKCNKETMEVIFENFNKANNENKIVWR